jgi:hypothetical protein
MSQPVEPSNGNASPPAGQSLPPAPPKSGDPVAAAEAHLAKVDMAAQRAILKKLT